MATFLSDSFTDTDSTLVSAHTPETGGVWYKHNNYTGVASINSNGVVNNDANIAVYYNNVTPASADYISAINFYVLSDTGQVGVTVRNSTAAQTLYFARYRQLSGAWQLYRAISGTSTLLGSYSQTLTVGNTYNLSLSAVTNGSGVDLEVKVDGVSRITATDTDASRITYVFKAGIWIYGGSSTTGYRIEDIVTSDVVADSVTLTDVTNHRVFQRTGTSTNVTLAGTYVGSPAAIQARIMSGVTEIVTWTTIDSSPTGGAFSGTIGVPVGGPYTAEVRFSDNTSITDAGTNTWFMGDLFVVIGQSNGWYWFNDTGAATADSSFRVYASGWRAATAADKGAVAFGNKYITATSVPCGLINTAVSGAALRQEADSGSGYYLSTTDTRADKYTSVFQPALSAVGGTIAGIITCNGERDSRSGVVTEAEFQSSLSTFLSFLRSDAGNANLPICVNYVGKGTDAGDVAADFQAIRNAQKTVINADSYAYAAQVIDVAMRDTIHDSDHTTRAERSAQALLYAGGTVSYYQGPIISTTYIVDSTTLDVTFAHSGGTDFTPTTSITGFEVFDGGTPVTISSAARQTATSIRLSLASALTGAVTLRYLYGNNPTITGDVFDNSSMALPLVWDANISNTTAIALAGGAATAANGSIAPDAAVSATGGYSTAAGGALSPDASTPLAGASASSAAGSLAAEIICAASGQQTATFYGSMTPEIIAALVGTSAAAYYGIVTPQTGSDIVLTGISAALAFGNVYSASDTSIYGQQSASNIGAINPILTASISGIGQDISVGTVSPALSAALSGLSAALSNGTVTPVADGVITLVGMSITSQTATLTATIDAALPGSGVTISKGDVGYELFYSIIGSEVTSSGGLFTVDSQKSLSGAAVSSTHKNLSAQLSQGLTGRQISSAQDSLSVDRAKAISGNQITSAAGNVAFTLRDITLTLTGMAISAQYGHLTMEGAVLIDAGNQTVLICEKGTSVFLVEKVSVIIM